MKVLHVAESVKGGVATYLSTVLPKQERLYGAGNVLLMQPAQQEGDVDYLNVHFFGGARGFYRMVSLYFSYVYLVFKFKPDVIHLHSTYAGFVCRLLFPFNMKRIVYCPHGWSFERGEVTVGSQFLKGIERALSLFSRKVICISEYELSAAKDARLVGSKLILVKNAIDVVRCDDVARGQGEVFRFLFVGRLDRQKGIDLLLSAFERVSDKKVYLDVVGESVVSSNQSRPQDGVKYHGWLTAEAVRGCMMKADCLVVPSRWEGFGLVVLEALALGLPVIVSDAGGLPELVRPEEDGLIFERGCVDALLASMNSMLSGMAAECSSKIMSNYSDSYSGGDLVEALDCVYEEVLCSY